MQGSRTNSPSHSSHSHHGSEIEDFSESSDFEKDIDICDDDNKVSSSVETPLSGKEMDDEEDELCSPGDSTGFPLDADESHHPGNHRDSSNPNGLPPKSGQKSRSNRKSSSRPPKVEMKGKCNCDEFLLVNCHLETKDLWDKFHDLGTEMIITKTGR